MIKRNTQLFKKIIALFLSVVMCLSLLPMTAFASGVEECPFCGHQHYEGSLWTCSCCGGCSEDCEETGCYLEHHCHDCGWCFDAMSYPEDWCMSCMLCAACWDDSMHCTMCYVCESDCGEICSGCNLCNDCAKDLGWHCPGCGECTWDGSCTPCPGYSDENDGFLCVDCCINEGNHCDICEAHVEDSEWCPYHGEHTHHWGCPDPEDFCEGCGECRYGNNDICPDCLMCLGNGCQEMWHCISCGECTYENGNICEEYAEACDGAILCLDCCDICFCSVCGDFMIDEDEICEAFPDHCVDCCNLCDRCGETCLGFSGEEECPDCGLCFECCQEVSEENGCTHGICVESEAWFDEHFCENCETCDNADNFCPYCGLCEDCCEQIAYDAGSIGGYCIERDDWDEQFCENCGESYEDYGRCDDCGYCLECCRQFAEDAGCICEDDCHWQEAEHFCPTCGICFGAQPKCLYCGLCVACCQSISEARGCTHGVCVHGAVWKTHYCEEHGQCLEFCDHEGGTSDLDIIDPGMTGPVDEDPEGSNLYGVVTGSGTKSDPYIIIYPGNAFAAFMNICKRASTVQKNQTVYLKLGHDVGAGGYEAVLSSTADLMLDLNGYTLNGFTSARSPDNSDKTSMIRLTEKAKLTVYDSTKSTGKISAFYDTEFGGVPFYSVFSVEGDAECKLTINSGIFDTAGVAIISSKQESGTVEINGGSFTGTGTVFKFYNETDYHAATAPCSVSLIVNGGTFRTRDFLIFHSRGRCIINDGDVEVTSNYIIDVGRKCELFEINGGKFKSLHEEAEAHSSISIDMAVNWNIYSARFEFQRASSTIFSNDSTNCWPKQSVIRVDDTTVSYYEGKLQNGAFRAKTLDIYKPKVTEFMVNNKSYTFWGDNVTDEAPAGKVQASCRATFTPMWAYRAGFRTVVHMYPDGWGGTEQGRFTPNYSVGLGKQITVYIGLELEKSGSTLYGEVSRSVTVKGRATAPEYPRWEGTVAKWDAVPDADKYFLILYKNNLGVRTLYTPTNATQYDFSSALTDSGSGTYKFQVRAYVAGENGIQSGFSPEYRYRDANDMYTLTVINGKTKNNIYQFKAGDTVELTGIPPQRYTNEPSGWFIHDWNHYTPIIASMYSNQKEITITMPPYNVTLEYAIKKDYYPKNLTINGKRLKGETYWNDEVSKMLLDILLFVPDGVTADDPDYWSKIDAKTNIGLEAPVDENGKFTMDIAALLDEFGSGYYQLFFKPFIVETGAYDLYGDAAVTYDALGVSGTVTSYGSESAETTIQLLAAGAPEPSYETTVTGNVSSYTIDGIVPGNYTLRVLKPNHVSRDYTVKVVAKGGIVTQNVEICLIGDVTGNGIIDLMDYRNVLSHVRNITLITDEYKLKCANVDGNTKVDLMDYRKILSQVRD